MNNNEIIPKNNEDLSLTEIPQKISPDAIFQKIDLLRDSIREVPPNFMERVLSRDARERNTAIEQARIAAIKSRTQLIQGLSTSLNVYVQTHANQFKITASSFLSAQLAKQTENLQQANESTISSFFETYSVVVERISKIPNLTENQRRDQIERAYTRANTATDRQEKIFNSILDDLARQVKSMVEQITSL